MNGGYSFIRTLELLKSKLNNKVALEGLTADKNLFFLLFTKLFIKFATTLCSRQVSTSGVDVIANEVLTL